MAVSVALYLASSQPRSSVLPIFITTCSPAIAGSDAKERPALPRKSFALSQGVCFDQGPMKMWKLHSLAWISIGTFSWYASSAGFT